MRCVGQIWEAGRFQLDVFRAGQRQEIRDVAVGAGQPAIVADGKKDIARSAPVGNEDRAGFRILLRFAGLLIKLAAGQRARCAQGSFRRQL